MFYVYLVDLPIHTHSYYKNTSNIKLDEFDHMGIDHVEIHSNQLSISFCY